MIVLATDSFFMAMFFFLSGLFAGGHRPEGPAELFVGSPASARPAIRDLRIHGDPLADYAISLRHHPEIGFSEFWWTMITKGPWPRADLVPLGLARLRRGCLPAVSAVTHMLDPINRLSLYGRRRPAVFFAVMLAVTATFYFRG